MTKNIEDLKMLLGMKIGTTLELTKPEKQQFNIEEAMKRIWMDQPAIKYIDNELAYLKKVKKDVYEPFIPNVGVFYTYSYNKWDSGTTLESTSIWGTTSTYTPKDNREWTAGLSLTIPLFDLVTIFPKVKADKTLMKKLRLEKESAKEQLVFHLKKSYVNYQLSEEKAEASEQSYKIALERLYLLDIQKEYKEISDYESQRAKDVLDQIETQLYYEKLDNLNKREELFYILGDYSE